MSQQLHQPLFGLPLPLTSNPSHPHAHLPTLPLLRCSLTQRRAEESRRSHAARQTTSSELPACCACCACCMLAAAAVIAGCWLVASVWVLRGTRPASPARVGSHVPILGWAYVCCLLLPAASCCGSLLSSVCNFSSFPPTASRPPLALSALILLAHPLQPSLSAPLSTTFRATNTFAHTHMPSHREPRTTPRTSHHLSSNAAAHPRLP